MSIRKRTVSLTADAYGAASSDFTVGVDVPNRFMALVGLEVPSEDNTNTKQVSIEVYEVDDYDVTDSTADVYGKLLFHVRAPRVDTLYQPRIETHGAAFDQASSTTASSGSTSEENGFLRVRSSRIRVDVSGATPSSTLDVELFFQSAGDYRF